MWYYRCTDMPGKGLDADDFVAIRATFSRCKSDTGKFKEVGAPRQSRRSRSFRAGVEREKEEDQAFLLLTVASCRREVQD